MSDAIQEIVEACPTCGQPINVTDQEPFTEVVCPACGKTMRARLHFNNYTLLEMLGEGGMGAVFKALDNNLDRKVALKILKRDAGSTEEDWAKLASEARLTAAINHTNVVKVFSFGEDHGQFYLAMELVEKGSLDGLMVLQTRLAEAQVLDIGIQIAEGLQAAYEGGLIHRDIKPGNILFANARLAKIVDFGLARVLSDEAQEAGEIWGTPFYVAPEKLDGRPEDFRSDIYSLGGTLFHALAGRPPFDAKTASMVVLKHIKSKVVSLQSFAPNVTDETAYVINRMLHKDPDKRYPSYEELLTHLHYARQKLQKRSTGQGGAIPLHVARQGSNRAFLSALWSGAAVLCLVVAAWFFVLRKTPPVAAGRTVVHTVMPLFAQGAQALGAGKFDEAHGKFQEAVSTAEEIQPARNWALAQLGLASVLLNNTAQQKDTFSKLEAVAFFDAAPAPQALGRFFHEMSRRILNPQKNAPPFSGSDYGAFGLLCCGIHEWNRGEVDAGGALLEKFVSASPGGPDAWIADLKPVADPFLADYRRYKELRDAVEKGADAADLVARIDQAKNDARTGAPMQARLEALSRSVKP
jgi:eukaryotic-like serine/threonine-protein kinase